MADLLPDALPLLGLILLVAGVTMEYGPAWALMVAGIVLLATGVVGAWTRNR